ncbi:non-ribosomal peptide synthase [Pedobacter cryoconitis]|uniref:Non-ribosomal peptide synthase n=1 Tax=Pedobacter cryoconitis TaxID=188932 RepID=A0A127V9S9_9SPHI|nr:non-ribosomal peptide synthetase [Pedobacter cryoconitis]AMP97960.1 non-ribosomal peptide synthase [Pedobacter cryoconitis]
MEIIHILKSLDKKGISLAVELTQLKLKGNISQLSVEEKTFLKENKERIIDYFVKKDKFYFFRDVLYFGNEELDALDLNDLRSSGNMLRQLPSRINKTISVTEYKEIKKITKEHNITFQSLFLAAYRALLYRYTEQKNVILYTNLLNADGKETLFIKNKIEDNETIKSLIGKEEIAIHAASAGGQRKDLVADQEKNTLLDEFVKTGMFFFSGSENQLYNPRPEGISTSYIDILINDDEEQFNISIDSHPSYKQEHIQRLLKHLVNIIKNLPVYFNIALHEIDYRGEGENQILEYPDPDQSQAWEKENLIAKFEASFNKYSTKTAIDFEGKLLSYGDVKYLSDKVAYYISSYTGNEKSYISICLNKSEYFIPVLLGVIKSGNAYVVIDPFIPEERKKSLLEDISCKLIFDELQLQDFLEKIEYIIPSQLKPNMHQDDPVYLMCTSGSTGKPKVAINTHKGLLNLLQWYKNDIGIGEEDNIGIISNISFDLTQKNYFAPLLAGATIYLENTGLYNIPGFIDKNKITIANVAPAVFSSFTDAEYKVLGSLRKVIFGGEKIDPAIVKNLRNVVNNIRIYNSYGPSEASDVSSFYEINKENTNIYPIGKAIPNVKVYIMDSKYNVLPLALKGEIVIGGIGVGLGYVNNPSETDIRFYEHPKYGRLYRTGDLGRLLEDYNFEFLGRNDFQVKLRGNRVELQEIESATTNYSSHIRTVLANIVSSNSEKYIAVYYSSDLPINNVELKKYLTKYLPDYMIPMYYISLGEFPLTPNGKIDRKALPPVSFKDTIQTAYVEAKGDFEIKIRSIWAGLLNLEESQISTNANFFAIGGTSLKLLQLVKEINQLKEIKREVTPVNIFEFPQISELAGYLNGETANSDNTKAIEESLSTMDETLSILNNYSTE